MAIVIFILVLWYGNLFFQSFFLHRYAAHQVFTMSKTMEQITFVLTWIFQGSSYLSAYG
ncbi:MAG: stearoyl-CoA desaturase (delta-9 desaturase), partial [Saprospiraceae bacterium]